MKNLVAIALIAILAGTGVATAKNGNSGSSGSDAGAADNNGPIPAIVEVPTNVRPVPIVGATHLRPIRRAVPRVVDGCFADSDVYQSGGDCDPVGR